MIQKTIRWKVCTVPPLCSGHQVLLPRDNQYCPVLYLLLEYSTHINPWQPWSHAQHRPSPLLWGGSAAHSLKMLRLRVNPPHCSPSMMRPVGLWPDPRSSNLVFALQLWLSQNCTTFLPPLPSQESDPCPGIWKLFPPHSCCFSPLSSNNVFPNKPPALVIPFWFLLPGGPKLTDTHPFLAEITSMYTETSLAVRRLRLHGRGNQDPIVHCHYPLLPSYHLAQPEIACVFTVLLH